MSEEKKDSETDFSEYARKRSSPPPDGQGNSGESANEESDRPSTTGRVLRGCAIALGIAALIFVFVVGACFIALSR